MMYGAGWGMAWTGWIFMIVLLVLLAGGIAWLVRGVSGSREADRGSARRILDERFASGQIDPEEYERRRQALR